MCSCGMWDELNQCCVWEKLEKIFPEIWEGETEIINKCLEEMP